MSLPILHITDGQWWFNSTVTPVRFWPYTTHVTGRILEVSFHGGDAIDRMRTELVKFFNEAKVKAEVDNKTVFEIDDDLGRRWCLGFYDLTFTLGTSCRRTW